MLFRLHYLHNVNVYQRPAESTLAYSFKQANESGKRRLRSRPGVM